ncbi:MAG: MBL fold metallo-hydrolase, partial [Chloroflexota bacterium]|nr:MBL fold metallo-hydrolase [Chloroflexota bacterium]
MAEGQLRLTVVGSAAAWSRQPGRASSCYLVELDGHGLVMDFGQGAFSALSAYRDPQDVRAILVSHLHPDHGIDLVPLRHYLQYGTQPPASLELHAPADIRRRYDVLVGEEDFLASLPGEPLEPGTLELPPFEVTVGAVTHKEPSFAFRVAPLVGGDDRASRPGGSRSGAPRGLVYSGDCGREEDL